MENLQTEVQQPEAVQEQVQVQEHYDPSANYRPVDEFTPQQEEVVAEEQQPAEIEEVVVEQPVVETPVVEAPAVEEPKIQYVVPDELKAAILNPETFQDIVRIQSMNSADAVKNKLQRENPWATSPDDLDALLLQEFPDYDPDIPENNGMDSVTLKRFNFIADGEKKGLLTEATSKLEEKINSFVPAPKEEAPFDEKAFEARVYSHIDNTIAAYKAPEIPKIEGFELNATDYLLKPISFDRFKKAIDRAEEYYEFKSKTIQPQSELNEGHMFVKADSKMIKINYEDIWYVEAFADYVKIYTSEEKRIVTLQTMKNMEQSLPSHLFARVHRSYIVAIQRVESIGAHEVKVGNKYIPLGKNYKEAFSQMMYKK
jgi:hypothetical protein